MATKHKALSLRRRFQQKAAGLDGPFGIRIELEMPFGVPALRGRMQGIPGDDRFATAALDLNRHVTRCMTGRRNKGDVIAKPMARLHHLGLTSGNHGQDTLGV